MLLKSQCSSGIKTLLAEPIFHMEFLEQCLLNFFGLSKETQGLIFLWIAQARKTEVHVIRDMEMFLDRQVPAANSC